MPIQVQPCCCDDDPVALPCTGICQTDTTQPELILTVPAGTFTWSGFNCPDSSVPDCAGWLEGTFLLEQTAACFWAYAPPVPGPCDPFAIATCFPTISYLWTAGLTQRTVGGVQHAILTATLNCHVITTTQCLQIEQGYWELDMGPMALDCSLPTDQTLTLIRRSGARCFPATGSTVLLRAA